MSDSIDDRKRGSLLGLAWGDSLGCPVEYWPKALIRKVYGAYSDLPVAYPLDAIPAEPRIRGHLRPLGLHSDDTQQALTLIIACLHPEGWNAHRWTRLLLDGANLRAWRGTGRNFRSTLEKLATGAPPLQCGMPSAGIGAAMRTAPLGALYADDRDELASVVFEASWSTHADIRALSVALAVAAAAAMLIAGSDVRHVRETLPAYVATWESRWASSAMVTLDDRNLEHKTSTALRYFFERDWISLDELRGELSLAAARDGVDLEDMDPASNHAYALLGGIHALCVALWPSDDPGWLLTDAIQEGGDADTVGAIAGGLLGARFGTDWIPIHRCIDASTLLAYADSLINRRLPEQVENFLARETRFSAMEREHIARLALAEPPAA